jgi:type IV pilus assembly protein PilV
MLETHLIRQRNKGVTLIEVLVTLLIIGVGLLGLLGLQAKSLAGHKDTMDRKAAAEMISQIGERMRANHLGFMDDNYAMAVIATDPTPSAPACGISSNCTAAEIASLDKAIWLGNMRKRISESGAFIVTSSGASATMVSNGTSVRVTVVWREAQDLVYADSACTDVGVTDTKFRCLAAEVFP